MVKVYNPIDTLEEQKNNQSFHLKNISALQYPMANTINFVAFTIE